MNQIIQYLEAKSAGLKRYFDGLPCLRGHISERMTTNRTCIRCLKISKKKRYYEKHEAALETLRASYKRNREARLKRQKIYTQKNSEKIAKRAAKWNAEHEENRRLITARYRTKNRARINHWNADYRRRKPEMMIADAALRRSRKRHAVPKWANPSEIRALYALARRMTAETGIKFSVDHVVPLAGKNVCGLHCIENLQIIELRANLSKSNRFRSA